ncbi:MAG TPA: hypothetical protein V6C72_09745 [Chroococcales cyanobacterium]
MKGIQEKLGSHKMEVLLLSVDLDYGEDKSAAEDGNSRCLVQQNVTWPNVLLPGGFDPIRERFNFDGYGLIVIDANGIVRAINPRGDDLEEALKANLP